MRYSLAVTRYASRFATHHVLLIGLVVYSIGYTIMMSANNWYILLIVNLIATIGELLYSPILNAEKANMMPVNQRGSYSAFAGIGYNGANLIARLTIIVGAYLVPSMMSVYMGCILLIGSSFLYIGMFVQGKVKDVESLKSKTT
ncbi:Major Facilitator Superfamily protein [Halolactibacillus halophilus]|uniref:Major Facilitator Superfamily protein n=1 Tax=Halolactibacillus halophilus TaxID=306540 RepID=A0A1I5RWG4_9BACI|nr:MFS transporter [Halolactibacillus halophilus]GEM02784.1 hypothetical protein HHA03_23160 [Halolactibacillus halophilus]SFP62865.1 Major Facilitator Superfamily protein [Halolactibacillus halophilus]